MCIFYLNIPHEGNSALSIGVAGPYLSFALLLTKFIIKLLVIEFDGN